jgi:hypothetical protein
MTSYQNPNSTNARGGYKSNICRSDARIEELKTERSMYMGFWSELSEQIMTQRGRFLGNGTDAKIKRNTKQYNSRPRLALRTLAAGMMSGLSSPARPWFKLSTTDPKLAERKAAKQWLFEVQTAMYRVFSQSNFYNSVHQLYTELGLFGTASMGAFQNYNNVARYKTYTAGQYLLGVGRDELVNTHGLEYQQTVAQLVEQYGYENCSKIVQDAWDNGALQTKIDVVHLVEPNDNRDSTSPFSWNMPFRSVIYEKGGVKRDEDNYLLKSGFQTFPFITPRWELLGEDIYATDCPSMTAIGDCKGLQLGEKRKYQALDKVANPPLQGDANVISALNGQTPEPGKMIPVTQGQMALESVYKGYAPDFEKLRSLQQEVEYRINEVYYVDLFLMMISSDRREITAAEVAERHEEKLLQLGPVLERVHTELLDRAIDRTFDIMVASGIVPPAPREMQGQALKVDYVSILAQAQKMVAVSGLERTAAFTLGLVNGGWTEARHKFNPLQAVDDYAEAMGTTPELIRSDDEANELIAAEQQALAAQQNMANMQNAATVADTMASAQSKGGVASQMRAAGTL